MNKNERMEIIDDKHRDKMRIIDAVLPYLDVCQILTFPGDMGLKEFNNIFKLLPQFKEKYEEDIFELDIDIKLGHPGKNRLSFMEKQDYDNEDDKYYHAEVCRVYDNFLKFLEEKRAEYDTDYRKKITSLL